MAQNIKFLGKIFRPDIRKIGDLESVIFDKKWLERSKKNSAAYLMYRGLMERSGLRYDVTIMPFRSFGQELPKTLGHYHSFVGSTKYRYPEIYEVLEGKAIFFFQKLLSDRIKKVFIISAKKNDKIIIPPGYGHIIMNLGPRTLKTSNLSASESCSDYSLIEEKGGCIYFALKSRRKIEWIKNKKYGEFPVPEYRNASDLEQPFLADQKLADFQENISKFEFLKNPSKFDGLWKELEK